MVTRSLYARTLFLTLAGVLAAGTLGAVAPSAVARPTSAPKEPVNSCYSRDNTNPVINLLRLRPLNLDVTGGGRQLTVRAKLLDLGGPGPASGVSGATVTLQPTSAPDATYNVSLRRGKKPFVWKGTQLFPAGSADGTWHVTSVYITDKAGGSRILDYGDLNLSAYDRDLTVNSVPDTSVPELLHLALTPKRVDTRKSSRNVVITAKARDIGSAGVGSVQVEATDGGDNSAFAGLTKVKGRKNTFRGRMFVAQWQGSARWHFESATVYDKVGNSQDYTQSDLAGMGDHRFRVIGRLDNGKPSLTGFHISTRHIDVRTKPKTVSFGGRARDAVSGVQFAYAAFFDSHGNAVAVAFLRAIKASAHVTDLKGRLSLRPCGGVRGTFNVRVIVADGAGHTRTVHRGTFTVRANDRKQPTAAVTAFLQDPNSVKINFNENIDGISLDSVTFAAVSSPLAPISMSSVTCYPEKNLGGTAPVDCMTGHVRSAAFAPNTAFTSGMGYYATVNPEGTLAATDLAGNPFHQFQIYFQIS